MKQIVEVFNNNDFKRYVFEVTSKSKAVVKAFEKLESAGKEIGIDENWTTIISNTDESIPKDEADIYFQKVKLLGQFSIWM